MKSSQDRLAAFPWELVTVSVVGAVFLLHLPLSESLWVDEALTAWISAGTVRDTVERAVQFQGQSPLYFLLAQLARNLFGGSELALRASSAVFAVVTVFLVVVLGSRWLGRRGGCLAAILVLSSNEFAVAAVSARPYSLALCATLASIYWFDRYCSGASRRSDEKRGSPGSSTVPLSLAFASLVIAYYAHYLFIASTVVHAAIAYRHRKQLTVGPLLLRGAVTCAVLLPGLIQLLSLSARSSQLSFAGRPTLATLTRAIAPVHLSLFLLATLMVVGLLGWLNLRGRESRPLPWLVLTVWFVGAPLVFFIYSTLGSSSVFIERLFLWSQPGGALLTAALVVAVTSQRGLLVALAIAGLFGLQRNIDRRWFFEDWRSAATVLASQPTDAPVLLFSGLIEAEDRAWRESGSFHPYIAAPLQHYGVRHEVIPIGSAFPTEAPPSAATLNKFYLVTLKKTVQRGAIEVPSTMISALQAQGFRSSELSVAGTSQVREQDARSTEQTERTDLVSVWLVQRSS